MEPAQVEVAQNETDMVPIDANSNYSAPIAMPK